LSFHIGLRPDFPFKIFIAARLGLKDGCVGGGDKWRESAGEEMMGCKKPKMGNRKKRYIIFPC
jgi:hypothetical protein